MTAAVKEHRMTADLDQLAAEDFCYLTTRGRVSGRPHTIEIWFAQSERTLYMLAGGREGSDWPGYGEDLTDWGRDSLPVAVDLAL
jgi:hypothetical protein